MAREQTKPNPNNATIEELKAVSRVATFETSIRCTAIQMLITGISRELVCKSLGITDRSIRTYINLFNKSGVDGLIVNKRPGRTEIILPEQRKIFVDLLDNPEKAERYFWTAKAFHGYISDKYQVSCSYSTVVRFFHKEGFALKYPRPVSDLADEEERKIFKKEMKELNKDPNIDIWFCDESGFEGDPRPRQQWDRKGSKSKVINNGTHIRMNVIGMVCPRNGEFYAIEVSHSDTETFQVFIDCAHRDINFTRPINILVLDNAAWHKNKSLNWHGWEPKYLPKYSPDLNPIERLWLDIKENWFKSYISKDLDQLLTRLDAALCDVINNPEKTKKTTAIGKLL